MPSISSHQSLHGEVEPSPPPPYGLSRQLSASQSSASGAPTPPMQDSTAPSRELSQIPLEDSSDSAREEKLRVQRAADAAKALGLNMDFETGSTRSVASSGSEGSLNQGSMRSKLREMKRQMRRREKGESGRDSAAADPPELVMAAQFAEEALQTQEQLLAYLPRDFAANLPMSRPQYAALPADSLSPHHLPSPIPSMSRQMSSSSSRSGDAFHISDTRRPFRTMRLNDANLPFPMHHQRQSRPKINESWYDQQQLPVSRSQRQVTSLQQEVTEERISVLEQALFEARESEDNQRKVAARWRREMERLQRDFERAEETILTRDNEAVAINGKFKPQQWRRREATVDKDLRTSCIQEKGAEAQDYGWGSTAFPQFPVVSTFKKTKINVTSPDEEDEPDLGEMTDRLRRLSVGPSRGPSPSSTRSRAGRSPYTSSSLRGSVKGWDDDSLESATKQGTFLHTPSRVAGPSLDSRKLIKKVSQGNFHEPNATSGSSSRLTVESSSRSRQNDSDSSSGSGHTTRMSQPLSARSSSFRRSPWPTPQCHGQAEIDLDDSVDEVLPSTLRLGATPRPSLSPAFASLSQRMESMRAFVSSALDPNSSFSRGRTLQSELGDHVNEASSWDISMSAIEQTLLRVTRRSPEPQGSPDEGPSSGDLSRLSEEIDPDSTVMHSREGSEEPSQDLSFASTFDGTGHSPAPLPAHISAALSSLAMALAPAALTPNNGKVSEEEGGSRMAKLSRTLPRIKWALDIVSPLAGKGLQSASPQIKEVLPAALPSMRAQQDPWLVEQRRDSPPNRRPEYRLSLPIPARPTLERHGSSDGSVALAHRRQASYQIQPNRFEGIATQSVFALTDSDCLTVEFTAGELQTVPGKLVHDLICLLAIMMEFLECAIVIVFRVAIDMRYNRKSVM